MKSAEKRRKLLVVATLAVVCVVTVLVTLRQQNAAVRHGSASIDPRIRWPELPPLPYWPKWQPSAGVRFTSPQSNLVTPAIAGAGAEVSGHSLERRSADSLSVKTFPTPSFQSLTLGFVNVNRLLAAYPPKSDSKESRAEAITEFQHVIACRAEAHDCIIVFDVSGETLNGVPLLLGAEQSFDLTEEVLDQLIAEHSIELLSERR